MAAFYRDASVGLITPLRDGMNLVAKVDRRLRERDLSGYMLHRSLLPVRTRTTLECSFSLLSPAQED